MESQDSGRYSTREFISKVMTVGRVAFAFVGY